MRELQNFNSSNKNNLLVILPINKVEDFYLNESLYSIAQQEYPVDLLILVNGLDQSDVQKIEAIASGPKLNVPQQDKDGKAISQEVFALKELNFIIKNTDADTFSKTFNEGLNYAIKNNYKYFSFIEHDDVVDVKWYKYANIYMEKKPNMDGYLPLTKEISNGVFLGYFNEACWVDGFAEVAGVFDLSLMMRFNCMNITGTIFKTESIKTFSQHNKEEDFYRAMKESVKINYVYEFFLRMIYKDLKFYSIPRIGYEHRIDRQSNYVNYMSSKLPKDIIIKSSDNGGITEEEYKFWNNLIKKEFYFDKDRNIQFESKK